MKAPPYATQTKKACEGSAQACALWWIAAGAQAWSRAKAWATDEAAPRLTACLPPGHCPADYRWDFLARAAALVAVVEREMDIAESLAGILLAYGATAVLASPDVGRPNLYLPRGFTSRDIDRHPQMYPLLEFYDRAGGFAR